MCQRLVLGCLVFGSILMATTVSAVGDEGMWVFNNLPLGTLKARHGFEPPPGWADHLRSSAVRFNSGGSGSFVSADGLIMTNHHVGADTLAKLGTKEKDYYRDGFFAKTHEEEAKAPDLELNVLVGIEDVTDRVNASVTPGLDDASAEKARRQGDGRDREGIDRQDRACGATSSRSTRAGSITSTRTRSTPTSGSSSPPSSTARSSAAIRTTSSIPATTSTSASSGPTRTASPPGRRTT